jgi:hypothetical protein
LKKKKKKEKTYQKGSEIREEKREGLDIKSEEKFLLYKLVSL